MEQEPSGAAVGVRLSRRQWLYGVGVAIVLALSAAAIIFVLVTRPERGFRLPVRPIRPETTAEKTDRLAIMNLLNQANLAQQAFVSSASAEERKERNMEYIDQVTARLTDIQPEQTLVPARDELRVVFADWKTALAADASTRFVRDHFKELAREYPWLDSILWIVILNRL